MQVEDVFHNVLNLFLASGYSLGTSSLHAVAPSLGTDMVGLRIWLTAIWSWE